MATAPKTDDRDNREAETGRTGPARRPDEPARPGDTPGGGPGDEQGGGDDGAGDDLVQGGEAPGIDVPPGGFADPGAAS